MSRAATDVFTPEQRSAVMARVRGRDTGPERAVRKLLTRMGLRYRLQHRDLPGSPDIAMAGRRVALFVHGCFWHGHACRRGARAPKQNADYWRAKIARNTARDAEADARLRALGWRPLVVWECELRDPAALEARLRAELDAQPPQALRSSSPEGEHPEAPEAPEDALPLGELSAQPTGQAAPQGASVCAASVASPESGASSDAAPALTR